MMTNSWPAARSLLVGVALGSAYGVSLRLLFGGLPVFKNSLPVNLVMTVTFLIGGPIAIGYLTVNLAERLRPLKIWQWILVPWIPIAFGSCIFMLIKLEGWICILFALPITLTCASLAGIIAGLLAGRARERAGIINVCVAFLPLLFAPIESRMNAPVELRRVETQIRIDAPAQSVWANIERVPRIERLELPSTWTQRIGFPRPLEASLSFEGAGGVRHATFEGGLLFVETITRWERNHVLRFSIRADTVHIPPSTLDDHVTIGGKYFDVLDGEYVIEAAGSGVILHLSSEERLSTDFNGYAGLWSDAVMRDIQESILRVVKARCEKPSPTHF